MKIKKFYQINEKYAKYWDTDNNGNQMEIVKLPNFSKDVNEHIHELYSSLDSLPFDWIETLLKKTNLSYKNKEINEIANIKKLDKLKKYTKDITEIDNLIDKLYKKRKKTNISYTEGFNELYYTFQKDLLENDFYNFYNFFINEYDEEVDWDIDDINDKQYDYNFEIHPELYKENKDLIINNVRVIKNSNKYNL